MGYTEQEDMVRVDFFKQSGKWYCTEAVRWIGWGKENLIHDAFKKSLRAHFKDCPNRLSDMDAICLKPYHELEHPICVRNGGWTK
jgi:hypothetical protein